jgi:hypothetical protein
VIGDWVGDWVGDTVVSAAVGGKVGFLVGALVVGLAIGAWVNGGGEGGLTMAVGDMVLMGAAVSNAPSPTNRTCRISGLAPFKTPSVMASSVTMWATPSTQLRSRPSGVP